MEIQPIGQTISHNGLKMQGTPGALNKNLEQLSDYGGFSLIENLIEEAQNLNPAHPARREIFLTDNKKAQKREELLAALTGWAEVLTTVTEVNEMVALCEERSDAYDELLDVNLARVVGEIRDVECSYRNAFLFFENAETDHVANITFVNGTQEQLRDLEHPLYLEAITEELKMNFDRLDLRNNYSLLVIPRYLGSNSVIERWGKIAHEHKVMLITDFENLDAPDDVMEMFEAADLTGGEVFRSNIIMGCNWIVGRGKHTSLDEEEDLFVPPSGALAGKIYNTLMSQVAAGTKFGKIVQAEGVKFELRKNEIANLERMGLIPMVKDNGHVIAHSAKTLFNGDNLGLQTYSVVRVFDYVTKVLIDFLNRRAFENFNANTRKDLMAQMVKFLDSITGPEKLIEDFTIKRFEQDPVQKDRIYIDIHMKPYFPAKNFMIKMEGQRGEENAAWATSYDHQELL
jgi:hypothetical protein